MECLGWNDPFILAVIKRRSSSGWKDCTWDASETVDFFLLDHFFFVSMDVNPAFLILMSWLLQAECAFLCHSNHWSCYNCYQELEDHDTIGRVRPHYNWRKTVRFVANWMYQMIELNMLPWYTREALLSFCWFVTYLLQRAVIEGTVGSS
jgi:hypothetical protein